MWWLILWFIALVVGIPVLGSCIGSRGCGYQPKPHKEEKDTLNKLSKEGTQSALRHFHGAEESEDMEEK